MASLRGRAHALASDVDGLPGMPKEWVPLNAVSDSMGKSLYMAPRFVDDVVPHLFQALVAKHCARHPSPPV